MTTTTPDEPAAPEPTDPTERIIVRLDRLIVGVDRGTEAVDKERRWRRLSFACLALVIAVAAGASGYEHYSRVADDRSLCSDRRARVSQNVKVQAEVAAYEATFYGRPAEERDRLAKGVAKIVADALPPPDC